MTFLNSLFIFFLVNLFIYFSFNGRLSLLLFFFGWLSHLHLFIYLFIQQFIYFTFIWLALPLNTLYLISC
ncbi:hypothetical protein ACMBCN_00765 [Candidatus Liberibacter asiaticus]|nr:hypothetical protein [Candidatus Liberibacter asiaticus]